jgi:FkbM family methyltransferase
MKCENKKALLEKSSNMMLDLLKKLKTDGNKVVIYGASDAGKNYVNVLGLYEIPILCFIDDDLKKQNSKFCGITVCSMETFIRKWGNGEEVILVASYSPSVIINKLREKFSIYYERVKWSDFYLWENELNYFLYYQKNINLLNRVLDLLCDEKSKSVFRNLLNYKISRNRLLIEEIQDNAEEQYFTSEIIKMTDQEVFLDLGAYTGDSIRQFCKVSEGKYAKIIAVEPDEMNFQKLKENTKGFPAIDYHQVGIADKNGIAKFAAQALYTSHFDEEGTTEIETKSVDSIMRGNKVTFIKADIEGLETEMIKGARYTIETYKPKVAIAVYHKKEDIFNILLLLYAYRSDYKFYMRHYTEMPIDTVLYAI